jgi:hypothetical protein
MGMAPRGAILFSRRRHRQYCRSLPQSAGGLFAVLRGRGAGGAEILLACGAKPGNQGPRSFLSLHLIADEHSRTCDEGREITRKRVTRGRGTITRGTDLVCPVAGVLQILGHRRFFGEIYHDANDLDRWFGGGGHRARRNVRSVSRPSQRRGDQRPCDRA